MAADLFRVVRTVGTQTLASKPIPHDVAMDRFEAMAITWRMDRVRVLREQDFQAGQAAL